MVRLTPRRWFWLLNAAALLCLVLSSRQVRLVRPPRALATHVIQAVIAPVAAGLYLVQSSLERLWPARSGSAGASAALRARYENQIALLQARLAILERMVRAADLIHRNFPGLAATDLWAANVAGFSTSGVDECTLDQGWRDNRRIRAGDAVMHALALVGRVISVGPETSTVRLLTDPAMKENVWIVRGRGGPRVARAPRENAAADLRAGNRPLDQAISRRLWAGTIISTEALVEGTGADGLSCRLDGAIGAAPPQPGDLIVLHDNDWPAAVTGAVLGAIVRVARSPRTSLRWHLRIAPRVAISRTRQVLIVLTRRR